MVSRECGVRNVECGMAGLAFVRGPTFHLHSAYTLHSALPTCLLRHHHVPRPALALAERRDEGEPGADGTDHYGLTESALDASHRGVAHSPRHGPAGEDVSVGVSQDCEEAGAIARRDGVG